MSEFDLGGPGTAAYSPSFMPPDGLVMYGTRSNMRQFASAAALAGAPEPSHLLPPDPSAGGEMGQPSQLGWSNGFGFFRRRVSFTGRALVRKTMGANPPVGSVGFSTRTSRLKARIEALYTDYTPSNQAVAREVIEGGDTT